MTVVQRWRKLHLQVRRPHPTCKQAADYRTSLDHLTWTARAFIAEPQNPISIIGGNALLSLNAVSDSALANQSDVLVFDSDPLNKNLEFCGKATIEFAHSISNSYAGIFVRVSEVRNNGKLINVTEGYRQLNQAKVRIRQ